MLYLNGYLNFYLNVYITKNSAKREISDEGVSVLAYNLESLKKLVYFAVNFGGYTNSKITILNC